MKDIIWIKTCQFTNLITKKGIPKNMRAKLIDNLFSEDAFLRGTVSKSIRTKYTNPNIYQYFLYFSQSSLPDLKVLDKKFNIHQISSNVWSNYAYVKFQTEKKSLPVTAEMTFIFTQNNDWKIQTLDSNIIIEKVPEMIKTQNDKFIWNNGKE